MKKAIVAIAMAGVLPLSACGDNSDAPTSPTQAGPPVSAPGDPTANPSPTPQPPAPPPDAGTPTTIRGVIAQMSRSGPTGIDVVFRIDNEPIRGDASTVVIDGSKTGDTTYLRDRQAVTIDARLRPDHVYAKQVIIDRKP